MTIPSSEQAGVMDEPAASTTPCAWLAVRSLSARHRTKIAAHLSSLGEQDRYLRFGYVASDNHILRYVEQIDFDRDEVFGIFNRRLRLVAMAHLASLAPVGADMQRPGSAEFGVSVAPHLRGRGIGARLFDSACLHARNRGIDTLIVHALTENKAMLRIARSAGATLEYDGPDSTASLRLPPENLASHWSQMVEVQAGEVDYGLKSQALRVDRLVNAMLGLDDKR
jgi:RimJ/RimL family protein N-acetyltransferase